MKFIKFLIALLLTIGVVYLLDRPLHAGATALPPIGRLLNPFSGFWHNAENAGHFNDLEIKSKHLRKPVKVQFDERRVPHIFAGQLSDALYVQGYLCAKNRLFQMDISSRAAGGRLSEIFGSRALEVDRGNRRMGMNYAAEKAIVAWRESSRDWELLEAFTTGVNDYIFSLKEADYPLEFKLIGYEPELWTPLKTALLVKSMAKMLCARERDIGATNVLNAFGQETYDFLFPEIMPGESPVIPTTVSWDFNLPKSPAQTHPHAGRYGSLPFPSDDTTSMVLGSNSWALSGSKTASGHPILCNDPHLQLSLPAIWYELQIHSPEAKAYGVCIPGIPAIAIGFNENIAWGMTNVSHDVLDYYQINWTSDDKQSYHFEKGKKDVELRIEKIIVKDEPTVYDTVRYTIWGPIVTNDDDKVDLAMHWLSHETSSDEISLFRNLNTSRNYSNYVRAIASLSSPPQNIIYADRKGDIAMTVQGKFPIKAKGQGRFIMDGSKDSSAWKGYIPNSHNPRIKNPPRGYVSSANQRSTDTTYPYYYNGYFEEYRGRILNRFLDSLSSATFEDMKALQQNTYSLKAEEALPTMLKMLDDAGLSSEGKSYLEILRSWDYQYSKDAQAPLLFEKWMEHFGQLCWDEMAALEDSLHEQVRIPETWRTIDLMKTQPASPFFDIINSPQKEQAKDVVQLAFLRMVEEVNSLKDKSEGLPDWQDYKNDRIRHLARIDAFSSEQLQTGGDRNVLNAIRYGAGPSWRMIVELGDPIKAVGIYPGGQSGNPGSAFYDHTIKDWEAGKYYDLHFLNAPLKKGTSLLYELNFDSEQR